MLHRRTRSFFTRLHAEQSQRSAACCSTAWWIQSAHSFQRLAVSAASPSGHHHAVAFPGRRGAHTQAFPRTRRGGGLGIIRIPRSGVFRGNQRVARASDRTHHDQRIHRREKLLAQPQYGKFDQSGHHDAEYHAPEEIPGEEWKPDQLDVKKLAEAANRVEPNTPCHK